MCLLVHYLFGHVFVSSLSVWPCVCFSISLASSGVTPPYSHKTQFSVPSNVQVRCHLQCDQVKDHHHVCWTTIMSAGPPSCLLDHHHVCWTTVMSAICLSLCSRSLSRENLLFWHIPLHSLLLFSSFHFLLSLFALT